MPQVRFLPGAPNKINGIPAKTVSHFFWLCDHFATILRAFCVAGLAMWQAAGRCPAPLSPSPFPLNQTYTMQVCGVSRRGSFLAQNTWGSKIRSAFWHMQFAVKIENLKISPARSSWYHSPAAGDDSPSARLALGHGPGASMSCRHGGEEHIATAIQYEVAYGC